MWKHYLKTAWRHLKRSKVFSFINIIGLSVGLTCSMLILLFVKDELSFDKFHKKGQHIFRVVTDDISKGENQKSSITGLMEGPAFSQHIPGIKAFVRYFEDDTEVKNGSEVQSFTLFKTDSNFFSVFSFPLIAGNTASCLKEPYSIVLSKDEAIRQFGSTDIIGKTLLLKSDTFFRPYTVTAVAQNCPKNSSFRFNALIPLKTSAADQTNKENWFDSYLNTFVLLDEHANVGQVVKKMQLFFEKDAAPVLHTLLKKYGLPESDISSTQYDLQPLKTMHLDKGVSSGNGITQTSSPLYSYILSCIALFILLIACINFINLTVARSIKRAKEIGIRKVVGSSKKQLNHQFMGESALLCLIAFILALIFTELLLPLFNTLANKSLSLSYLLDRKLICELFVLFAITSFIAGFYPAIVLARFEPTKTLYNRFQLQGKNYLQKSLVVVQFVLACFLVVLTFVLYQQFNFLTRADLGYNDNNLVAVYYQGSGNQGRHFKSLLKNNAGIMAVGARNDGNHYSICKVGADKVIKYRNDRITQNFFAVIQVPVMRGRNFSLSSPTDSVDKVIINEAFVKEAGWVDPVGQTITFNTDSNRQVQVIGVVKNYHYGSLNDPIDPQMFQWTSINDLSAFYIKIKPDHINSTMDYIKQAYGQSFPLSPFSYGFVQQSNKMQYSDIAKWRQILLFGGLITILISFMGLFGLSVLASERRKKEIGIRKVYGASVRSIIQLLTTDYLKLVVIAMVIATPVTILAASKFLQTMLYRIPLSWQLFIIPDIMVILLAFLTVYIQTRQSAITNPVKSLKDE
ncbi:ABC transporter permease [Arachidicoccus terrestris]|uniref:ABC transporter permease n=1 Tax=Arachidicoccus terrestris TaxID=2875539 RepID=UPI001CC726B4|nr:ABC transporter permease [Arachidicoccus terrestris]UAY56358.1 ABC transporter permease [Arachidicoccus terrestris]